MALMQQELPNDLIKSIEKLEKNAEEMMKAMTQAGADVVEKRVKASAPTDSIRKGVKKSRAYKTPSDGGVNTFVYISGYAPFKGNRKSFSRKGGSGKNYSTTEGVPLDFIAKVYEYGRKGAPFPKKPFFRKSFKKNEIEQAMLKVQDDYFGRSGIE